METFPQGQLPHNSKINLMLNVREWFGADTGNLRYVWKFTDKTLGRKAIFSQVSSGFINPVLEILPLCDKLTENASAQYR